mmetsp:Transcript_139848/g.256635  ORF Transcript_139848/g.256635 Transcript_139848/m.256635 type:complete len:732 (-) Transcript_139848:45-2240(-)
MAGDVPSLWLLCVKKLAQSLIRHDQKKVRFGRLSGLPRRALEALLQILVAKNALNDNVLPHALTQRMQTLGLEGASQLRRSILNTIGRSCPRLRALDVRGCQQVDNRIVRDVLQCCEHLQSLRLDGCTRISDSAFAPALWKPPLAGLLGLGELSVGKCCQITGEGLMGYVMKGAPYLKTLGLASISKSITDEVASELLFSFGLEELDLSSCTQITDAPFSTESSAQLRELRLSNTQVTDKAIEHLAQRAPDLQVLDVSEVMRITDHGVLALTKFCYQLRQLCVGHTQITDASFTAIAQCVSLEKLDASWCLKATTHALDILAAPGRRPPIREFVLDHLAALDLSLDCMGLLPAPASPEKNYSGGTPSSSPMPWHYLRPPEPPSLALPPPATPLAPGTAEEAEAWPCSPPLEPVAVVAPSPSLLCLVEAFAPGLELLLLDGVREVVDAKALEAIASQCPLLRQLALMFPASWDSDSTLEAQLRAIGSQCTRLSVLRLDASARASHCEVVAALELPSFGQLTTLSLWCSTKAGGLLDSELEVILSGRTALESLALRNCEGLSEGLFPRWCNRGERHDEAEVKEQLDQDLLSSQIFGHGILAAAGPAAVEPVRLPARPDPGRRRRRKEPRCPAAVALRSVASLSLAGASQLSDRSADALAELLHDAQTIEWRGSPLLTEESLRSFRKRCLFLRLGSIVTRDRTLSWNRATSAVKKHRHRKSRTYTSGSSGTESN